MLAAVLLIAAACGDDATSTAIPATSTPVSPGETPEPTATPLPQDLGPSLGKRFDGITLRIPTVSGPYLDATQDVFVEAFEEGTGAKVVLIPAYGEEIVTILAAPADDPPYDCAYLFIPDVVRGMAENLLLPFDRSNIPNLDDVPEFFTQDFGQGIDINFAAPLDFGFGVIGYNKDEVPFTPSSYKDLLRPEIQGELGFNAVYWFSHAAAIALAHDFAPGVDELYTPEGWDSLIEKMREMDVALWYDSGAAATAAMERGDITILIEASEVVDPLALRDPDKFGILVPDEGAVGFMDYYGIVRGTKYKEACEIFINYILDPELQRDWAELVPYWMSNSNVEYGDRASALLPDTYEERVDFAIMLEWDFIVEHWDEYWERLKKEVYSQ